MAGSVAQAVECLPSKCEALNSNPSTAKKEFWVAVNTKYGYYVAPGQEMETLM
jgi:hypothetical protein